MRLRFDPTLVAVAVYLGIGLGHALFFRRLNGPMPLEDWLLATVYWPVVDLVTLIGPANLRTLGDPDRFRF